MPEPVSLSSSLCRGYAALNPYARQGSAVSAEAQTVTRAATEIVRSAERSQALFGERAGAIARLWAVAAECAEQGWDGGEACAFEPSAIENAEDFVRALPEGIPMPEFAPEPDGAVSLDWIESRYRMFTISVGQTNRLAFAWLDGSDSGHGVARFDGVAVPPRVLMGIRAILRHGNAPVRLA
jgi:hypothetical protein